MTDLPFFYSSVPSKTFLLGEYSALAKRPALLLATEPRFSLQCQPYDKANQTQSRFINVSEQGPVAQLIKRIETNIQSYCYTFHDPYQHNPGGFGASSAQYILLYDFYCQQTQTPFVLSECLKQFYDDLQSPSGILPSGADMATHCLGQLTLFSDPIDQSKTFTWPWSELTGVILKTNVKLATHTHLAKLTLADLPITILDRITQRGIEAIETNKPSQLLDAVNEFQRCLTENQLTCKNTLTLLHQLTDCPFVLATKGCGAQGADVIIAFVATSQLTEFNDWITTHTTLTHIATTQDLSDGLDYKENQS